LSKKIVTLLLALTIVLAFTACGPAASQLPAGTDTPAATDAPEDSAAPVESAPASELTPYEITYYLYSIKTSDQQELVEKAINEIIQPKFNATVDFVMITGADWSEKAIVPLRAGVKIDAFWTPEWQNLMENVNAGSLLPLDDASGKYGDLIHTYAPQTAEDLGPFYTGNIIRGNLYCVATIKETGVKTAFIWNKAYVDKYNIPIQDIKTLEQLEPVIYEFRKNEPDVYPVFTIGNGRFGDTPFLAPVSNIDGIAMLKGEPNATDGELFSYWDRPETESYLATMRKWYKDGMLHPDSALSSYNEYDMLNSGQFLLESHGHKGGQVKSQELMSQSGNPDLKLEEVIVESSAGFNTTSYSAGAAYGIPVTSQDPARAMMFINEIYQNQAVLNLMTWGVEGVHYTLSGDGRAVPTEMNGWSDSHGGFWSIGPQFKQIIGISEDAKKYEQMKALCDSFTNHESLGFRMDPSGFENEYAALANVKSTYSRALLTGALDEAGYKEALTRMTAAGLPKVLEEAQKQYAAFKAAKFGQ
jgi:putative aldouronate transport system substrate-binding protein